MSADHVAARERAWSGGRRLAARLCVAVAAICGGLLFAAGTAFAAGPPTISHEQVAAGTTQATPEAKIDPNGLLSTCGVEYVSEASFEASGWAHALTQPCAQALGSGEAERAAFAEVGGLTIDTHYRYRFLAENQAGAEAGAEATFVTFGIESFTFEALGPELLGPSEEPLGQEPVLQAGSHPFELVTHIALNVNHHEAITGGEVKEYGQTATPKDVDVQLPPGLIGNPSATPARCPQRASEKFLCTPAEQVGVIELYGSHLVGTPGQYESLGTEPLFNVAPPRGDAARFSARFNNFANAVIDAHVRTGNDYGIDADSLDIATLAPLSGITVRMWGVPASPAHTPERSCPSPAGEGSTYQSLEVAQCAAEAPEVPFLTMPTACAGPLSAGAAIDAFQEPGAFTGATVKMPAITGCETLAFNPSIEAQPTTAQADSPSGMSVDLHVPQDEEPEADATSELKDATVAFPAGIAVNPSSADGLGACSEKQAGFTGFKELDPESEPGVKTAQFTPQAAECPNASKLGAVTVHTPLLEHPITGGLYLATPHENPFGSLVAVYLAVYDPVSGVVIKLPGKVSLNKQTGQITTTFEQNPQLPFEDLEVSLFGGNRAAAKSRASLTTPQTCGRYSASSSLTPWDGNPAATPSSKHPFEITSEPGGGACPASEAQASNAPGLQAGTASPIAGSYSPFVLKLTRNDGSQRFKALNVTLPPGLVGKVTGVEECPQADIEAAERLTAEGDGALEQVHPSCPAGSRLGAVHVGAGSGAPFFVNGSAYFAGPYDGAPFSLVFITPAVAGPFDLGTVTVRAALFINPETAQVTVKSNPFPTILDGIPLDIRSIGVEMNRPGFTLNPTSCNVMAITGAEASTAGQYAPLSERFQVGGCNGMPFNPVFAASSQAKTSRKYGASLTTTVRYPAGAVGQQANMRYVKVKLPTQLPVRFSTVHNACPGPTFEANPASCPAGSVIGRAVVHTPILPVPLTGPAYFVGHGAAKFPELIMVLQGDGVTVELRGNTYIAANGVISTTFKSVPDVPFESFQLSLPEGPDSALSPGGNLCYRTITKKKRVLVHRHGHLVKNRHRGRHDRQRFVHKTVKTHRKVRRHMTMPVVMIGQNGVELHSKTRIHVTGCGKPKAHGSKHHKKNHHKKKRHKHKNHGRHAGRTHRSHKHAGRK